MNVDSYKRGYAALIATCVLSASGAASAKSHTATREDSPVCAATYKRALERLRAARLREAQDLFVACSRAACGESIRQECIARRAQLQLDIPSVVPLATDDAGEPRVLVEVRVDGELLTSRLDGQAVTVDPGKHIFSFGTDDGIFETQHIVIAQGERNRPLHVVLHAEDGPGLKRARELVPRATPAVAPRTAPAVAAARPVARTVAEAPAPVPPAAPAPATATEEPAHRDDVPLLVEHRDEGPSAFAYVFGGLGLAGVGGFALLTYWGRSDNNMLADCSPSCPDTSVQHVRRLYWGADVALGMGIASLAVSTVLFATSGGPTEKTTPKEGALSFDVQSTGAGAVASLAGRF